MTKFTIHFGSNTFPDLAGATRLARLAEAAGFDSVVAVDHVVYPDTYTSTYPYAASGRLPGDRTAPLKEEFEALGVPFEKRGKRSDEYIAAMRALWAQDGASFSGEF
ncbi:MAG: LLM class flavin-dependent oxidoreductase, partial [Proteobacteria bacterium]|nr:LLM class flavin-dependent oxidoreductase [Pseudomonadota bacterium]